MGHGWVGGGKEMKKKGWKDGWIRRWANGWRNGRKHRGGTEGGRVGKKCRGEETNVEIKRWEGEKNKGELQMAQS